MKNIEKIFLLAALAVAAFSMVAVPAMIETQQAFADTSGCSPGNSGPGNGFFSSDKKCFKPGNK